MDAIVDPAPVHQQDPLAFGALFKQVRSPKNDGTDQIFESFYHFPESAAGTDGLKAGQLIFRKPVP
jgi:hypothetical protein